MWDDDKRMTFTEHLAELRMRIIHSGIAVIIAMIVCYIFSNQILLGLQKPLTLLQDLGIVVFSNDKDSAHDPTDTNEKNEATEKKSESNKIPWVVLNPFEIVILKFKVAGYGGLILALPYVLWQACAFIFPGLKPNERHLVKIILFGCSSLGIIGVIVAYFGVIPLVIPYLLQWIPTGWEIQLRANETISIIVLLLFGFALAFQFPMVILALVYLDLLNPDTLRKLRKYVIVGLSVISAILTPPDPISMIIMLVPLTVLYEISIWASYLVRRRQSNPA
ncbi:MAG TPA: twin-arginine translocase subunit TatC [Candidatus Hydrogenedens sp.]|nr:twin-arginine translocase subunit TatC [Candidatus Hydrogenedens sp.]HOK09213.1 twin-arginine translocase subunit TatC [Candidatus Hydrogenedens sp.]HOL19762.1 twin-arginine translocase subunit TatC [Candidatus Hydrogenedens sp.]HPP59034.1 twin-arginine translocase subunit TatC [Candidatus Hydrogenedens sp.]